jgi:hypothetical protein
LFLVLLPEMARCHFPHHKSRTNHPRTKPWPLWCEVCDYVRELWRGTNRCTEATLSI